MCVHSALEDIAKQFAKVVVPIYSNISDFQLLHIGRGGGGGGGGSFFVVVLLLCLSLAILAVMK